MFYQTLLPASSSKGSCSPDYVCVSVVHNVLPFDILGALVTSGTCSALSSRRSTSATGRRSAIFRLPCALMKLNLSCDTPLPRAHSAASTVLLMDSTCASHWSDYTSNTESPPGLDTLREFCEHRLTALQSNPNVKKPLKPPAVSNQQQSSKLKERPKSTVYHVRGSWDGFRDT